MPRVHQVERPACETNAAACGALGPDSFVDFVRHKLEAWISHMFTWGIRAIRRLAVTRMTKSRSRNRTPSLGHTSYPRYGGASACLTRSIPARATASSGLKERVTAYSRSAAAKSRVNSYHSANAPCAAPECGSSWTAFCRFEPASGRRPIRPYNSPTH